MCAKMAMNGENGVKKWRMKSAMAAITNVNENRNIINGEESWRKYESNENEMAKYQRNEMACG